MVQTPIKPTIAAGLTLEAFLELPQTKPAQEFMNGQIYPKPMPQGEHRITQGEFITTLNAKTKPHKIALALPELRCTFGGRSIVPDVAVFTWDRLPKTASGRIGNKFTIAPN